MILYYFEQTENCLESRTMKKRARNHRELVRKKYARGIVTQSPHVNKNLRRDTIVGCPRLPVTSERGDLATY